MATKAHMQETIINNAGRDLQILCTAATKTAINISKQKSSSVA
jgi:hypothetical protein